MESTEADEQEPLNKNSKNHDLKSDESTENFQKFIFELFEKNGILNDLRAYLRGHIVNVIKSTNSGEPTSCQKHFTQRLELSYQALNILIAEYFLRMEFSYTLSVFISEIPLANMLFEFAKTLMKCTELSDVTQVFFRENDVWSILNCLGMKCDSEHACKIVETYTSEEKLPLLLCIMKCMPMYRKQSICMENAVTSEEYVTSDRSTDTDVMNKSSDKRKCRHYTVCWSCSSRESKLKEKISKRKMQYNQSINKSSLNSLDMNTFMRNLSVVEKGIINEMFEEIKTVYETEVAMVKQDEHDKIQKSIASHAMQLQKHRQQLEETFKEREVELSRSVEDKKRFLWRLAKSLRQQHEHMNRAMEDVREENERLAAKETNLKTQIQDAENLLRKRGEEMRQQIANELQILDQHLQTMKRERDAINIERMELENLKSLKEINNNKCEETDVKRHYNILKEELQDLKKYMEMANVRPNMVKCFVEKGTVTETLVNNLMNNEHFVLKGDRVMNEKVNNDLSRRKNVNFDMSNEGFGFNDVLVRPSRSSLSSDVEQSDRDRIDCEVCDINRDRIRSRSRERSFEPGVFDRDRELRTRSHDCDREIRASSRERGYNPDAFIRERQRVHSHDRDREFRVRSRDRMSNHSLASDREVRSLDRASRSRNRDLNRTRDRKERSRDRHSERGRDIERDLDDGERDRNRSCDRDRDHGRVPYEEVERLREENERLSILARQQSDHIATLSSERTRLQSELLQARPLTAPTSIQPLAVARLNNASSALSAVGGGEQLTLLADRPRVRVPTDTLPFIGVLEDNRRATNWPGRRARRVRGSLISNAETNVLIVSEPQHVNDEQTTTQTAPGENTKKPPAILDVNKSREKSPKSVLREAKEKLRNSSTKSSRTRGASPSPGRELREAKLRLRKLELEAEAVETSYRAFRRKREEGNILDTKKSKSLQKLDEPLKYEEKSNYEDKRDLINRDFDKYLKEYQTKFDLPPFKNNNAMSELIKPIPVAFSEIEPNRNRMNFLETPLNEFRKLYHTERPRNSLKPQTPSPTFILDHNITDEKDESITIKSKESDKNSPINDKKIKEFKILQDNINKIYSCSPNMVVPSVPVISPRNKPNEANKNSDDNDKNLLRVDIENVYETKSVPLDKQDQRLLVVVKSSINTKEIASDPEIDDKNAITTQMTILVSPKDKSGEKSMRSDIDKLTNNDDLDDIFQIKPKKGDSSYDVLELSKEDSGNLEQDDYPDDFSADVDNYNSRSDVGQQSPISLAKDSEENFWES